MLCDLTASFKVALHIRSAVLRTAVCSDLVDSNASCLTSRVIVKHARKATAKQDAEMQYFDGMMSVKSSAKSKCSNRGGVTSYTT